MKFKNILKTIGATILGIGILYASAELSVPAGGTGLTSVPNNYILVGSSSPNRLQAISTTSLASLLNLSGSYVSGSGSSGQVAFWNGTTTQTGSNNLLVNIEYSYC